MMYCVKCQKKTDTEHAQYVMTKNNKILKSGRCLICKKTKTSFVSTREAKEGGFIFSIPAILGALGAAGSLAGGASAIASAVNKKKADDKLIAETKRHNEAMEAKKGSGLRLISAKKKSSPKKKSCGRGLYLNPPRK